MTASKSLVPGLGIRGCVIQGELLSKYTSIGIGGPAAVIAFPVDEKDILCILNSIKNEDIPFMVLGDGTNVLFKDEGFDGIVIGMSKFSENIERNGAMVKAESGAPLSAILARCTEWGLGGLEFSAGIPGLTGGAVMGNAGAFGEDVSAVIASLRGITLKEVKTRTIEAREIQFSYRKTVLPEEMIVTGVEFSLESDHREAVQKKIHEHQAYRRKTQPAGRTAGSVFKNPPGESAGKLLEQCDLKGQRRGGAVISDVHANFIINTGNATCADVMALVDVMRSEVNRYYGIELELEWKLY